MREKLGMNGNEKGNVSPGGIEGENGVVCVVLLFVGRNGIIGGEQADFGQLELSGIFFWSNGIVVEGEKVFVVFFSFLFLFHRFSFLHLFFLLHLIFFLTF